jgi:hypothetical protein
MAISELAHPTSEMATNGTTVHCSETGLDLVLALCTGEKHDQKRTHVITELMHEPTLASLLLRDYLPSDLLASVLNVFQKLADGNSRRKTMRNDTSITPAL